jgi:hypothetical protein
MKPELWIPLMSFGGTLAVLVVASLYNNSRLSDFQRNVSDRQTEFKNFVSDLLRAEDAKHDANTRRVEELMLHKFAELDDRLNRIETKLNM